MSRVNQYIKIVVLFVLLFTVVFIPTVFVEQQRKFVFDNTIIYPVDAVQLNCNDNNSINQKDSVWERIKLICDPEAVVNMMEYSALHDSSDLQEKLISTMEDQLKLLQSFDVFPELSFSDAVSISFLKGTYMSISSDNDEYIDLSVPKQMISIWILIVEYSDFTVHAYMDAETSALYDITVTSRNDGFLHSTSISENGFLEYLQLFSDESGENEDVFLVGGYRSDQMICMYPISVNKENGQIVSYSIGGHKTEVVDVDSDSSMFKAFEIPSDDH